MSTRFANLNFAHIALSSADPLPALALVKLDDWGLVTLIGEDKKSYLHGQVTCDVVGLTPEHSTLGAHCDAKGKMRTVFRLFHHNQGYALLQRASVMATQLPELKKYAVFSKVDIEQSDDVLLGLTGEQAADIVAKHWSIDSDVQTIDGGTLVKIDDNRWLIAVAADHVDALIEKLAIETLSDSRLWDLYDIKQGQPRIDAATELDFIPQAMNLQVLDAISFTKGCYTGQETVARAKYRGINKRAMYLMQGSAEACPKAGDEIQRSVGDNWRKGGTVIAAYQFADNQAVALVGLPNDLDADTQFRLADQEAIWQLTEQPYSLEEQD